MAKAVLHGEVKKVVLTDSRSTALRRCLIHVIPISTCLAIITLNFYGVFIGIDFASPIRSETINLLLLQIAAKLNEIFIVASLGVIVLQVVRQQLLYGDGLPLGLIGSSLTFGNFAFFFKKEFWGALRFLACNGPVARKISFVLILSIAGLIAGLAGPTSATLIVPKVQSWPSGGTSYFLPASEDQFWPSDLSSDISELENFCGPGNSTTLAICPGGGFQSLQEHWRRMNYSNFYQQDVRKYAKQLSGSTFYFPVHSPGSLMPPRYVIGNARIDNKVDIYTWLAQPHAATTTMLQRIGTDWWTALTTHMDIKPSLIDDRLIYSRTKIPITDLRCADPRNLSAAETNVAFPTIEGRFTFSSSLDFEISDLDTSAVDYLRFRWVHLDERFGAASIGALFESQWTADGQSRVAIGCTAQSGWVPADVYTDKYSFWSGWYPWNLDFNGRSPPWMETGHGQPNPPTNGRVWMKDDWLNLLTPPVTVESSIGERIPSTIENMLEVAGVATIPAVLNGTSWTEDWLNTDMTGHGKTQLIEAIVCSVLVDGMSRTGTHHIFVKDEQSTAWSLTGYNPLPSFATRILANKTAIEPPQSSASNVTTLYVAMQISGFSFRKSLAGVLSASVLIVYISMALSHIAWVSFNKHTSHSWVSVSELVALAQNSQPAYKSLVNTGAGIHCSKTFAQVAKVRVKALPGSTEFDHVELVFDEPATNVSRTRQDSAIGLPVISVQPTSDTRPARTSVTWPGKGKSLKVSMGTEMHSRSSSTERLMPRARLADEERGEMVRVNHVYG